MIRLNNKGQSLVIFIIFIPFLIIMGVFIVDLGYAKYNENRICDTAKLVVRYGLKHIEDDPYDEMVSLINKNESDLKDYKINVDSTQKSVFVSISKASKGFFGKVIGKELYDEACLYNGYVKEDKIIIEEGA